LLFSVVALFLVGSILWSLYTINREVSVLLPIDGGMLTEGIIGTPRFVNPVLAITRADLDLSTLIYSGLMKVSVGGELVEDLAESVTISTDGTVYSVTLKEDIFFHDGTPLTTADVAYTIALIQDPELKSPHRGNWNNVRVEVISDREINFILPEKYSPFIENLTQGILPKHLWSQLTTEEIPFSQHNTEPIGSGPYKVAEVDRDAGGLIESYKLVASKNDLYKVKIDSIRVNFYDTEDTLLEDLKSGLVDATGTLSTSVISSLDESKFTKIQYPLPRTFGLFINHNKSSALREKPVREALNLAIDKEALVKEVLNNYGQPTDSPIPTGFYALESDSPNEPENTESRLAKAAALLEEAGWSKSDGGNWVKSVDDSEITLSVKITTANTEPFKSTAEFVKSSWEDLGVVVEVAKFDQSDLIQSVIRPRDYQILLFGADVGRGLDLYPFWHSSQREDPGLNVALYTNIDADGYLEEYRVATEETQKAELLKNIDDLIKKETYAISLYNPVFVYVVRDDVGVFQIDKIGKPSDRLYSINLWHLNEASVWPIFTK